MRSPGSGTRTKRGWRVVVTVYDEYGHPKRRYIERRTLVEAQDAARVYLARHGRTIELEAGTLAELFQLADAALWSQAGDSHRRSMNLYRTQWERHLGEVAVADLDAPTLTRTLHAIAGSKSRSTITKTLLALRQAMAYAVSDLGWITSSPAENVRMPKASKAQKTYPPMTREEYERMLGLAEPKERLLLRLIGECGMRPSEAARVRASDLFSVRDRWLVRIPTSKTEAGVRSVPVTDELAREIEELAGKGWEGITDLPEHMRKWWRKHSETRLYDLRGWRADEWRRMGLDPQLRSMLMGHTNVRFTQRVYEQITSEDTLKMFDQ